jgi:hypothetical protein
VLDVAFVNTYSCKITLLAMTSSKKEVKLTSDQKAFLEKCALEFSERYTDSDPEYKKVYDSSIPQPPLVSPWQEKNRGGRYRDNHRDNYRDRDNYREYRGDYRNNRYNQNQNNYY